MSQPTKLLFLPGASGNVAFWRPVAARLTHPAAHSFMAYPSFGGVPPDPTVNGVDDLVARVLQAIDQPVALVAQSMGGALALHAVLAHLAAGGATRAPITHLVLTATSGGLNVAALGGTDWRPDFERSQPALPRWFSQEQRDVSAQLPELRIPSLLLWGDADPISPVAVGERLAQLLPLSKLHVLQGADHDLAMNRADEVAPLIDAHLHGA